MAFHLADFLRAEDEAVDTAGMGQPHLLRRKKPRVTVEALAWGALIVLSFGPLIGYLLATLL